MSSIKDVATKAGVSIATVSRYFRGTAKVSPDAAAKIKAAAKELNYIPDFFASSLKNTKTNFVCFMVDGIRNSFFNSLIKYLEKELHTYGYQLMLALSYNNNNVLKKNIEMFLSMRTSAFLYIPNSNMAETYTLIPKKDTYALQMFLHLNNDTDCVSVDDAYGTELAVDYFLSKGLTDIVMIDEANQNFYDNRARGYIRAFEKHGLTPPYENLRALSRDNGDDMANKVIEEILDNHKHPAIIAVANELGSLVVKHITERGLRFKKDVSLIIYDDIEIAKLMNITCIGHDKKAIAHGIVETVIDGIENPGQPGREPKRITFLPMLIERDSV